MAGSYNLYLSDMEANGDDMDVYYECLDDCGFTKKPWGDIEAHMLDFLNGDIDDMDVVQGYMVRSAANDKKNREKGTTTKKPRKTKSQKSAQKRVSKKNRNFSKNRKRKRAQIQEPPSSDSDIEILEMKPAAKKRRIEPKKVKILSRNALNS